MYFAEGFFETRPPRKAARYKVTYETVAKNDPRCREADSRNAGSLIAEKQVRADLLITAY